MDMTLTLSLTYFAFSLTGAIGASVLGYFEAKKSEPEIEFSVRLFFESMLRAAPGMVTAAFILGKTGLAPEVIIGAIITSLLAGTGCDVVLKRSWRSVQTNVAIGGSLNSAVVKIAKIRSRLMFIANRE